MACQVTVQQRQCRRSPHGGTWIGWPGSWEDHCTGGRRESDGLGVFTTRGAQQSTYPVRDFLAADHSCILIEHARPRMR